MVTDRSGKGAEQRSPAPAVTRAAAILQLLAGGPLPLSEVARALELAKSSTLNLLVALEQAELVQRQGDRYRLGAATAVLGGSYVRSFDVVSEFQRVCDAHPLLREQLLHLAVLHGNQVLYLARHEGVHPLRLSANVGDVFPASLTAVGNALLAELDDARVTELFADPDSLPVWTPRSVDTLDGLLTKLAATRRRGHAVDDRETNAGTIGAAVVVPPRRPGEVHLALGVSLVHHQLAEGQMEQAVAALHDAQRALSTPRLVTAVDDARR